MPGRDTGPADIEGIGGAEVLELHQCAGEDLLHRRDELVDQRHVRVAPRRRGSASPMYCGSRRSSSLSVPTSSITGSPRSGSSPPQAVYRVSLPIGIPIPWAPRSPRPRMRSPSVTTTTATRASGQLRRTPNPAAIARGDVEPSRPAEDQAELTAGLTHGGGVEDRQHFGEIVDDGSIEELLVAIEQGDQEEVLVQRSHQPAKVRQDPLFLLFLSEDARREESTEPRASRSLR